MSLFNFFHKTSKPENPIVVSSEPASVPEETPTSKPLPGISYDCKLSGLKKSQFAGLYHKNSEFNMSYEEIKLSHEIGEKIFENVFSPDPVELSLDKVDAVYHVFWNGVDIGKTSKSSSENIDLLKISYDFLSINVTIGQGMYRLVEKNDYYEDDPLDPDDIEGMWVTNDYTESPKGTLAIQLARKNTKCE